MSEQNSQPKAHTVPMWTLVGIIIGSTIGAGIFSLPQNIASVAAPGAMLIGWAIAGVGMLSVAFVFHILAQRKPYLDAGVYSYVRAGLGDFIGFASGWGYWLGSVIAQVGYATLFFSTIGHYVPWFDQDHRLTQAIAVSALTWLVFAGLTRGIKQAAVMNAVTTIAKLLPILCFVVLVAFLGFSWDRFTLDFWGEASSVSVFDQVQGIMLFTVWVFIGVEGASVYSKQAKTRADIGRATVIGFLTVLVLLVTVSSLSFGVLTQAELAALPDNSMAAVLEAVVGPWGAALVSIGLCLSVLGAYVSWQMLCAEPIAMMAADRLLPQVAGRINANGAPWVAQLISTVVIQLWVVVFFLNETTYVSMVQLATVMYLLPYTFSALYLVLLATRGRGITHPHAGSRFNDSGPQVPRQSNMRHGAVGLLAFVYSLWLLYAADPKYILFGALAVLPGLLPYVWTRLAQRERVFNAFEWCVVALVAAGSVASVWGLASGQLSL
ncbi:amino acid permease [Corynebacterium kozikiae]|uniref:amino acid permease n=1 Tax=Corynebacterium kozikiae TaxID=2968469 RepID=UPI00211B91FA|nr:amino acid permease [Corynebacterium sp. 76QC2CO]